MEQMTQPAEKPGSSRNEINEESLYQQLESIIDTHRGSEGALIPVLQEAQNLFGYLPEPALLRISSRLNKPYSEVAGVVGFYSFFLLNLKVSILCGFALVLPAMCGEATRC